MSRESDDDPKKLTVQEFLQEFKQILSLRLEDFPCSWWEDNSERRNRQISDLGFTRQLARAELMNLRPVHRDRGPDQDQWEQVSCALYVFRYPIPGSPGIEAYVKVALKRGKRGVYSAKWYAFERWE